MNDGEREERAKIIIAKYLLFWCTIVMYSIEILAWKERKCIPG